MPSVLITGSAGHLGRALRSSFKRAGYKVWGVDEEKGKHTEFSADLDGDWMDIDEDLGDREFDVVVCNASCEEWRSHHELARRARRAIVNIGSIYGVIGSDPALYKDTEIQQTPAWYVAVKGALIALTRHQATTLAPVRSNCVCPGGIFRDHSDEFMRRYSAKVPLKRMATEADIVPVVVFLAGDGARYITGQVLMVDGGLSSW